MNTKSARFFPNDLITEVLSVLPVKSILRFRCVSNSWNILISDSTFVKFHLKRSKSRNPLFTLITEHITYYPDGSYVASEYDVAVAPYSIRSLIENPSFNLTVDPYYELKPTGCCDIVGTCNGLICLVAYPEILFCLWNPSTRETSKSFGHFRDFDCSGSDHSGFMFGCDNSTDTYKVVEYRYFHDQLKNDVRALSFGDDRWRNIESFPVVPLGLHLFQQCVYYVYLSGSINWLAIHNEYWYPESNIKDITVDQFLIVSLDLGTEKYNQYRLPPSFDEVPSARPILSVLGDCLCFSYSKETDFIIWQMKKFGVEDSWTQFLRISYHNLQIDYDYSFETTKCHFQLVPVLLSEDGDTLILKSILEDFQAILYNWRSNTVERTNITVSRTITDDRTIDYVAWESIMNYVESLVSIL